MIVKVELYILDPWTIWGLAALIPFQELKATINWLPQSLTTITTGYPEEIGCNSPVGTRIQCIQLVSTAANSQLQRKHCFQSSADLSLLTWNPKTQRADCVYCKQHTCSEWVCTAPAHGALGQLYLTSAQTVTLWMSPPAKKETMSKLVSTLILFCSTFHNIYTHQMLDF